MKTEPTRAKSPARVRFQQNTVVVCMVLWSLAAIAATLYKLWTRQP